MSREYVNKYYDLKLVTYNIIMEIIKTSDVCPYETSEELQKWLIDEMSANIIIAKEIIGMIPKDIFNKQEENNETAKD